MTAGVPLLVSDLGRPERFLYMLRMFKVTSPMSVGSWILAAMGPAAAGAAVGRPARHLPAAGAGRRGGGRPARPGPGHLHRRPGRRHGRAGVARGAAASCRSCSPAAPPPAPGRPRVLSTPAADAGPARRLVVTGAAARAGRPPRRWSGAWASWASPTTRARPAAWPAWPRRARPAGPGWSPLGGRRRRAVTAAGAALVLAGSACERWAVYKAGFQSARDPRYIVEPQRARMAEREREQLKQIRAVRAVSEHCRGFARPA